MRGVAFGISEVVDEYLVRIVLSSRTLVDLEASVQTLLRSHSY